MRVQSLIVAIAAAGMLGGCGQRGLEAYHKYDLGESEPAVSAAVEFLGGIQAWNAVSSVSADAVMTLYDERGQAYVNSQLHRIDVNGGKLTIRAATPQEGWTAVYNRNRDSFWLFGASGLGRITRERLCDTMAILSHRLAGPLNLLGKDERPEDVSRVTIGGKDLVRVSVGGKKPEATAYYFSADGGELDMVTAGPEKPGEGGTVTTYTYHMLQDGMVFPKTIRVVKTGTYMLVGRSPVMEVEYSNVHIN